MAPTVQQFPQPASGFFSLPAVPPTAAHLLDRSIGFTTANSSNSSGIPPLQFPLGFPSVVSGFQIPSKFFAACLSSLCNEPEEKEKFEGAYFLPPPSTPWKKPVKRSEPPVMINGVQAFKKTSNVVQISPLRTAFVPTPNELSELTSHGPESEDADFQRHQLVPRAFLTQPLWSQLIPSNFVTRPRGTHLTLPCTSIFVLEPKAGKILFRPAHFVVTVTGPGDCIVPVQMRTDCDQNGKELRYVYCFRPQEPGTYLAKVRIAANGVPHVSQSPLKFRVTKSLPPPCPPPHPMMTRGGGVSDNHTKSPHNHNNSNNNNNLLENSCPWLVNNPRNNSNSANLINPMNNTVIPSYPELGVLC